MIANRAACIRHYLSDADPAIARRYSLIAARWEQLRLAVDKGRTTPADDARYVELSGLMRALTARLGLPACKVGTGEAIPGITNGQGFLPNDPCRIIHGSWQEAAEVWLRR
jgi:hypothetical protein